MNIEKMREEFEKFRDERNALLESEGHRPGSKWHVTNAHYPTWQASRAAIEIELPSKRDCNFDEREISVVDTCRQAIEAAGLKVKS